MTGGGHRPACESQYSELSCFNIFLLFVQEVEIFPEEQDFIGALGHSFRGEHSHGIHAFSKVKLLHDGFITKEMRTRRSEHLGNESAHFNRNRPKFLLPNQPIQVETQTEARQQGYGEAGIVDALDCIFHSVEPGREEYVEMQSIRTQFLISGTFLAVLYRACLHADRVSDVVGLMGFKGAAKGGDVPCKVIDVFFRVEAGETENKDHKHTKAVLEGALVYRGMEGDRRSG